MSIDKALQNAHKYVLILFGGSKMFATTGIIQGNTILTNDASLERYDGRKVIITVLEEEKPYDTISDEKLFMLSDALIAQNKQAYRELAQ